MAARKPSERRHGGADEIPELNLVPIMAIMVILIPMLIYMFTFHQIRVQRVMAPRRGTGAQKTNEEKKEKELNLTILIKKDRGFQVTWEQALMPDTQASKMISMRQVDDIFCGDPNDSKSVRAQGCWPRAEGCFCYDFAALYNELVQKKKTFSDGKEKPEKRVNITAESAVTWEVVSRTMDAATCRLDEEVYGPGNEGFNDYVKAKPKKGDMKKIPGVDNPIQFCDPLFPNIVFAMAE